MGRKCGVDVCQSKLILQVVPVVATAGYLIACYNVFCRAEVRHGNVVKNGLNSTSAFHTTSILCRGVPELQLYSAFLICAED